VDARERICVIGPGKFEKTVNQLLQRSALIAAQLAEAIANGLYPVGARLPSEAEFRTQFSVGRHTILEAFKILTEQGLIGRRRKTGTIVQSQYPISQYVHTLRDVRSILDFAHDTTLDIRSMGFGSLLQPNSKDFPEAKGSRWFRIAGLRSTVLNDKPLCWSEVFIPELFTPDRRDILSRKGTIYEVILERNGLRLDRVEQVVEAIIVPPSLYGALNVEAHSAALFVKRRYVAQSDLTFEITHHIYPAKLYSLHSIIRQRV
jgi:DNA-binding GntR family transcriptional regulator